MSQTLKVFTDGGARGNPGPAASGVAIFGLAGKERLLCGKYLGKTTNNVAEYNAFLLGLELVLKEVQNHTEIEVQFYADSLLAVKQLNGEFRVKNPNLAKLYAEIKDKEKLFKKISYRHIPREENKLADREVNKALDQHLTGFD